MKIVLTRDEVKNIVADKLGLTPEDFILQISTELATNSNHTTQAIVTVDGNGFIQDTKKIDETEYERSIKREVINQSVEEFKKYFGKSNDQASASDNIDTCVDNSTSKCDNLDNSGDNATKKVDRRCILRIDYAAIAREIERFIASDLDEIELPIDEGKTASGIHNRYNRAMRMYNLDDKVRIKESRLHNTCTMVRK